MAHIRTWEDIEARGGDDWLTAAEKQLIAACKAGEGCRLGDGTLPPEGTPRPDRELRAEVLRYLILGGCKKCPVGDIGVAAAGGHVTGSLDLDFCTAKGALRIRNCRFDHRLDTEQTRFALVSLNGSHLNGWRAQGMVSEGSVFLRDITATATVNLNGATIGGQLDCDKAQFTATEGLAFNAQGAKVTGGVFLREITATTTVTLNSATIGAQLGCDRARFMATAGDAFNAQGIEVTGNVFLCHITATATVDLGGATIGGQLACEKAQFMATSGDALDLHSAKISSHVFLSEITATTTVDLTNAIIDGQLACEKAQFGAPQGHAVKLQSAQIGDGLIWRDVRNVSGAVTFDSAYVRLLVDDTASWSNKLPLDFDGMTYDRIVGDTNAASRLAWLAKGSNWGGTFYPQPYTQLAKVLRDMGHDRDARIVLAEREKLLCRARSETRWVLHNGVVADGVPMTNTHYHVILWSWLLRAVVGYGHHPFRSVIALLALWAMATAFAHLAWEEGSFAPKSGPLLVSEGWQDFAALPHPANPAALWSQKGAPGQDWESFNRYAYAADLVIPIVDLGQTSAWAPSTTRQGWGWHLWWLRWVFIGCGWIVTALGAAAITGIIRRD